MQLTQQSRAAHDRTKHVSLIADMPVWRVLWLLLGSYWCVYSPLMAVHPLQCFHVKMLACHMSLLRIVIRPTN